MTAKLTTSPTGRGKKEDAIRMQMPPEHEIVLRALSTAMGLPRICALKACRRRKRCRGPVMVCREHRALVKKRMRAALKCIARAPSR